MGGAESELSVCGVRIGRQVPLEVIKALGVYCVVRSTEAALFCREDHVERQGERGG